jgi:crotonobetainyl-CoA:carnitine CoA-transferase CaiB-like acyl-CoA transferase
LIPTGIEIFKNRPKILEKKGLGFDDCSKINPKLIYACLTGYG